MNWEGLKLSLFYWGLLIRFYIYIALIHSVMKPASLFANMINLSKMLFKKYY